MEISKETLDAILAAAGELGAALRAEPGVQAFLQAEAAVQADAHLSSLEEQVNRLYGELTGRQAAGEYLSQQEINAYYALRDQLVRSPLVAQREARRKEMKSLCEGAGSALNSVLTLDYTALAAVSPEE